MLPPVTATSASTTPPALTTRPLRITRSAGPGEAGRWGEVTSVSRLYEAAVAVRPPVTEEGPRAPDLFQPLEAQVRYEGFVLVPGLRHRFPDGIDEHTRPVVVAVELRAYAVDPAHEEAVGDGMTAQLRLPHRAREAATRGGGGHEDELRAVETEGTRGLGEVAVVADHDTDAAVGAVEDRIAQVARPEIELLLKMGAHGDVVLAVVTHDLSAGVDEEGRVVELARHHALVEGHHEPEIEGLGHRAHPRDGGAVDRLRELLVPGVELLGEEPRGEDLLETGDFRSLACGLLQQFLGAVMVLLALHRRLHLDQGGSHVWISFAASGRVWLPAAGA